LGFIGWLQISALLQTLIEALCAGAGLWLPRVILPPGNACVPLCRPSQDSGVLSSMRDLQLGAGSGKGQKPALAVSTIAHMCGSEADLQSNANGLAVAGGSCGLIFIFQKLCFNPAASVDLAMTGMPPVRRSG